MKVGDASRLSVILLLQGFITRDYVFILTLSTLVLKGFLACWVILISHQAPVLCQSCLNWAGKSVYSSILFLPLLRSVFGRWFCMDLICICVRDIFSSVYLGYEAEGGREKEDRFLGKRGWEWVGCTSLHLNPRALWQAAKACLNENL